MTSTIKRIWFITGASSGLGEALAIAALQRGDKVVAAARRTERLAELADRFPGQAVPIEMDVRDEQAVRNAVHQAVAILGRIDVVANNAGYGLFGGVEEASDTQARAIFDTNVFGVLNVLRAVLPTMRAQRSGHILQGSSLYGQMAHPGVGLLAATKYAVEGMSDALVGELAPLGIHLTLVEPGPTATAFLANLQFADRLRDYDQTVRVVQHTLSELPLKVFADAERAAQAILVAVDAETPPLRLAHGHQAENDLRSSLVARLQNLDDWAAVTRGVDGAAVLPSS